MNLGFDENNLISSTGYSTDSPAYIMTNEDLRSAMEFMPKKTDYALVVAASGDHPLFASLYGAKYVDTFDISYNAKCLMNIKVAALNCLTHSEYISLLTDLSLSGVPRILFEQKLSKVLSKVEIEYLQAHKGQGLFGAGNLGDEDLLFTEQEYEKLQKVIKKPYSCVVTDVANLAGKLTRTYDFVHLSNVFEHMEIDIKIIQNEIILPLFKHVNVGGRVLFQMLVTRDDCLIKNMIPKFLYNPINNASWCFVPVGRKQVTVLERIR